LAAGRQRLAALEQRQRLIRGMLAVLERRTTASISANASSKFSVSTGMRFLTWT